MSLSNSPPGKTDPSLSQWLSKLTGDLRRLRPFSLNITASTDNKPAVTIQVIDASGSKFTNYFLILVYYESIAEKLKLSPVYSVKKGKLLRTDNAQYDWFETDSNGTIVLHFYSGTIQFRINAVIFDLISTKHITVQ